ncbi:MAG: hypothetical protein AB9866_23325 [Syntrophobacteraceae bacterium]
MKKHSLLKLLILVLIVFCTAVSSDAVRYRYEDLETLGGTPDYGNFGRKEAAINESGTVVGWSVVSGGAKHAFVKISGHSMQDLHSLVPPDSTASYATSINNSGKIGGYYVLGGFHACFWNPSGGGYEFEDLGGVDSEINAVNDAGYAAGSGVEGANVHAYVRDPNGDVHDLAPLPGDIHRYAMGMNNSNTVVGHAYNNVELHSCQWTPSAGSFTPSTLFGANTNAYAINSAGAVVGSRSGAGLWALLKLPGQPTQDLGNLGTEYSIAYDINDLGQVVGFSSDSSGMVAFLWSSATGMVDLRSLVVNPPPGVKLKVAFGINEKGEIAGYTEHSAFKLVPLTDSPAQRMLLLDD